MGVKTKKVSSDFGSICLYLHFGSESNAERATLYLFETRVLFPPQLCTTKFCLKGFTTTINLMLFTRHTLSVYGNWIHPFCSFYYENGGWELLQFGNNWRRLFWHNPCWFNKSNPTQKCNPSPLAGSQALTNKKAVYLLVHFFFPTKGRRFEISKQETLTESEKSRSY